jgi:hypothetical protein
LPLTWRPDIDVAGGGVVPDVTVTVAVALFVESAALVATTWQVVADPGAVYTPPCVTDPQPEDSWIDQVTAVFDVPATDAMKVAVPRVATEVVWGATLTETADAPVLTSTVAVAATVESATDRTTT